MTSDNASSEVASHHTTPSLPLSSDSPEKTEPAVVDAPSTSAAGGPNLADDHQTSTQNPPPALPKFAQASPELIRPDSAYGGSGGTPSLLSNESIDTVDNLSNDLPPIPVPANPLPQPPTQSESQVHPQSQTEQTPLSQQSNLAQNQSDILQSQSQPPQPQPVPAETPRNWDPQLFQQYQQQSAQLQQQSTEQDVPIDDDGYSTYADSAYDDAASLNESITDTLDSAISRYRWENGRRYHSYRDGAYWGPNDETHNDQQDIAHHAWLLALNNQLYLAPITNPDRILDVGTGTGIWAIEAAEKFPDAQVVGTDLSPIQPTWVPPNCMFEVDDVTMEWTFRKDSFDFIHSREMFGSIADWDEYFRQCYLHLKPGGWVEALERGVKPVSDDGTVGPDHFWTTWGNTVLSVGEMWGKGFNAWELLKERMEAAGFVDVVQVPMKWPIGPWMDDAHMKELGKWNALRLDTGLEGYVMRLFTMAGGWSYTEVQAFLGKFKTCMRDPRNHGYLPGNCVYGRKPSNAS
ncbi:MAG: hypothetical protein Q9222_002104 [Ikaeria aurantiellina]